MLLFLSCAAASSCFQKLDSNAAGQPAALSSSDGGIVTDLDTPPIGYFGPNGEPATSADACEATTAQATTILQTYCAACHGGASAGARQGQPPFDYVLDVGRLEAAVSQTVMDPVSMKPARFLVPGDPDRSRIYMRIVRREMPPRPIDVSQQTLAAPSVSDISVLRTWITCCLGVSPPGWCGGPGGSFADAGDLDDGSGGGGPSGNGIGPDGDRNGSSGTGGGPSGGEHGTAGAGGGSASGDAGAIEAGGSRGGDDGRIDASGRTSGGGIGVDASDEATNGRGGAIDAGRGSTSGDGGAIDDGGGGASAARDANEAGELTRATTYIDAMGQP